MKRIIIAMVAVVATSGAVRAGDFTEGQKNVMKHLAEATVIAEKCPYLHVDKTMMGLVMMRFGIPAKALTASGPPAPVVLKAISDTMDTTGTMTEDQICMAGVIMYGRNGSNGPGLLVNSH